MMRPPIKQAHNTATVALVQKYNAEWQDLVNAELARLGWAQETVEKKVWRATPTE